ncbi:uncharacterized protein METZ01_LOCUS413185 [marine metagenome]|uniref:Uncharacterized protein n=1 Tax=marine metagenome TaxID=408172 RepID=A0A382WQP4_9ZZZZ
MIEGAIDDSSVKRGPCHDTQDSEVVSFEFARFCYFCSHRWHVYVSGVESEGSLN